MVLPTLVGEFCLQKKIAARYQTRAISRRQAFSDSSLEIMPSLIGRINASKARAQRELRESRSAVFLPSGAVEKVWDGNWRNGHPPLCHEKHRIAEGTEAHKTTLELCVSLCSVRGEVFCTEMNDGVISAGYIL